jgi:hypothetical protein
VNWKVGDKLQKRTGKLRGKRFHQLINKQTWFFLIKNKRVISKFCLFLNKNDKGDVTVTGIIHEHMEAQNIKDYTLIKKKEKKERCA